MSPIGRSNESVAVNVESLVSSLELELGNARLTMPPSYCIFKTPSILFRHREKAFLPDCFSIGPMHHGKENLVATDKIKTKYLKGLLSRVATSHDPETMFSEEAKQQKILTDCINSIKAIERKASDYYAGHDYAAELGDEFVKMLVRDGCFIVELFRKDAYEDIREPDDPIFSMSCMLQFLHHDLILLENQIPWLVLQTLFDITKLPSETKSLIELALHFFRSKFSYNSTSLEPTIFKDQGIKHILDLLRLWVVLPSKVVNCTDFKSWDPIRSLTKLKEAGVQVKVVAAKSILDIDFEDGVLKIPSLQIQETTETIFRNLIAYEQCVPNCPAIFISYAKVLDNLIDIPNDLDILCNDLEYILCKKNKEKISWDNWLSPEVATQCFNNLYNDTYVKEFYYSKLCGDLNQYCKRWWPRWRASYVHNYFTKPWAIAAQIYAIIILFLTLWQAYYKNNKVTRV
ncbi:hypothetical protein COLO4_17160 [Corchorus olitorius]|uniref:Uncharacterized protein n=1 Tax=Corchorus olitorius TaxID=93759 RepID=A0A1R3JDW7_9ROSI|nr:hypothetical protein COLO4_17160 [Corchorus olitorius]